MNLKGILEIAPKIETAVRVGKPVVALESCILSHGLSYPENLAFSDDLEEIVASTGALPATTAVIDGVLKVGISRAERERLCKEGQAQKVSRRNLPAAVAKKATGATTASASIILASLAGIRFFATGGIGGIHKDASVTFDISPDLEELAKTPVAVVCGGMRPFLDIPRSLEYLETRGVPVIGIGCEEFPAFYTPQSGCRVSTDATGIVEAARIAKIHWSLGLQGGMLMTLPIDAASALSSEEAAALSQEALNAARAAGISGSALTPFLLTYLVQHSPAAFIAGTKITCDCMRAAGQIAVTYAKG